MSPLLLTGMHLHRAAPAHVEELKKYFEVCVLDFNDLAATVNVLSGRRVAGVVARFEYYQIFSALGSLLLATGTSFEHCLIWNHGTSVLSDDDLSQIGLCACIDVTANSREVAAHVWDLCQNCQRHPSPLLLDSSSFGDDTADSLGVVSPGADDLMADLVANGFSDHEIAEILNYSNQTIRNRMSRVLRTNGFDNRTQLGNARLRHSIQAYIGDEPPNPGGMDN